MRLLRPFEQRGQIRRQPGSRGDGYVFQLEISCSPGCPDRTQELDPLALRFGLGGFLRDQEAFPLQLNAQQIGSAMAPCSRRTLWYATTCSRYFAFSDRSWSCFCAASAFR